MGEFIEKKLQKTVYRRSFPRGDAAGAMASPPGKGMARFLKYDSNKRHHIHNCYSRRSAA